jgi:sugar lactone lactonase YvrE
LKASLLYKSYCLLGEGAHWHQGRKSFFWVDIDGKTVYEHNWLTKEVNQWQLDYRPSMVMEAGDKKMLLALQGGIATLNLTTGKIRWVVKLEKDIPSNRTNDGGCDAKGRLWIGTMDSECKEGHGSLYNIGKDLVPQKKLNHLSIPNGIVWTKDNKRMYHVETAAGTVRSYLYDISTGDIQYEKDVITVPAELGSPDGMCMDEEGMLWIAHWNGFGVYQWNPGNGEMMEKLELPVPNVTSCAFGGENMDYLLITTARQGVPENQLRHEYSNSGNVYIANVGVRGVVPHKFSGIKKQ